MDYEKLGAFYLGRPWDLETGEGREGHVLYDSKDLVTHAVCVGMTGSGKTGLCIGLLEEAAIDGVPAIVIDPKGDLGNLMLTFPELRPQDFAPWVNEDDARREGLSRDEYAAAQAEQWRQGLASWGQGADRIARFRAAAEIAIYTPGSSAGLPVSIVDSFKAPRALLADDELLGERVRTTVSSLLGLLGRDADPLRSREHILLSTVLDQAWRGGRDLDLAALIQQIQTPPVSRLGVLDLEAVYPASERFALAMTLNNLLATPGFRPWLEGEPLDPGRLLYTAAGTPRIAILSIAHLAESERMFFVSLLLGEVVAWMRRQEGTTSLRALLYMDEILGYLPPVENPPSKEPMLTLLKQARAYGLGVVLATQNPVDLDYKALSNAGTWFIGRLQTERDRARVRDGLQGVATGGQGEIDPRELETLLAGLRSRVFLLKNVHEDVPILFESRWVMSYLRGPLTREQIQTLMRPPAKEKATVGEGIGSPAAAAAAPALGVEQRPILPPSIPQTFLPVRGAGSGSASLVYVPMLLGAGRVQYVDRKRKIDTSEEVVVLAEVPAAGRVVDWTGGLRPDVPLDALEREPVAGARWEDPPPAAARERTYAGWKRGFGDWLYRGARLELLESTQHDEVSRPGEAARDFRLRLQQAAREHRDAAIEALRAAQAAKVMRLEEKIRRARHAVEREADQARQQKLQTAISFGSTLLSAVIGRKTVSRSSVGRATTAARGVSRSMKESQDVERARESLGALERQLAALEGDLERATGEIRERHDPLAVELETVILQPRRRDVALELLALAWVPYLERAAGREPGWE